MTKLLEQAIEKAHSLPPAMQDDMARLMLRYAGDDAPVIQVTLEAEADLTEADAEIARGEFSIDEEEVAAVFAKYQL